MPPAPLIHEKLEAFHRRWRHLILLRTACGAGAVLLGGLALAALLDRFLLVPDSVRIVLSAAVYLGTLLMAWWLAGRLLARRRDERTLARMVERAEPRLREDLLSAVELGGEGRGWDSPTFRARLRESVSGRLADVRVEALLPRRLVLRWLMAAGAVLTVCLLLLCLPGLRFSHALLRAAAPLANLERRGSFDIRLITPGPRDVVVPLGDAVPVTAQITGGQPARIELEAFEGGRSLGSKPMTADATGSFTATVQVNSQPVTYRVRADDSLTRRFTLLPRARPQVAQFTKTYRFPAYSRLPAKMLTEESGDLAALTGTEVELELHINQPVRSGELSLETETGTNSINLTVTAPDRLRGIITLTNAGTYRVRLVAAETGFESRLGAQFELRPLADLVPRVEITQPRKDLIAPADEVIDLRGRAEDDLALTGIVQAVRVNEGAWTEFPISNAPAPAVNIARRWDLLALNLNPGDQVATRLIATDLKGNRAESAPLKISIAAPGFDATRLRAFELTRAFRDSLTDLRQALRVAVKAATEAPSQAGRGASALQSKQVILRVSAEVTAAARAAARSWALLKQALPQVRPGREAAELTAAGWMLAQMHHGALAEAQAAINAMEAATGTNLNRTSVHPVTQPLKRAEDGAANLENLSGDLLAAQQADLLAETLAYLAGEYRRLADRAGDTNTSPPTREALSKRLSSLARESRTAEEMLNTAGGRLPRNMTSRLTLARETIGAARATLEKNLAANADAAALTAVTAQTHKALDSALTTLLPLQKELSTRAERARQSLAKQGGTAFATVDHLRQRGEALAKPQGRKGGSNDRKAAESVTQPTAAWPAAAAQLRARADLEEARPDADPRFVADLSHTLQAVEALRAAHGARMDQAVAPLKRLGTALRVIESHQELTDNLGAIRELAGQERFEPHAPVAGTARPRDWQWVAGSWPAIAGELRAAGMPGSAAAVIQEAGQTAPAAAVEQEMSARFTQRRLPLPVPERLEELLAHLTRAAEPLQPVVNAARGVIAEVVPALSERMKGLAAAAEQLEQQTAAEAARSDPAQTASTREAAKQLLEAQREFNRQIEELRAELRREANAQNLADAEGRERARDADDASAMLREPPQKAEESLREAAAPASPTPPPDNLRAAARQQRLTADVLKQLARHFDPQNKGNVAESRAALRQAESDLGLKSTMDAQYELARTMAEMAQKPPEEMLKALKQAAEQDPAVRKELQALARNALNAAENSLTQAAREEKALAAQVRAMADTQKRQAANLAEQAKLVRDEARKLAREDLPAAKAKSEEAGIKNANDLDTAAQALARAAKPGELPDAMEPLAREVEAMAGPLREASAMLREAQQTAAAAAKSGDAKARAAQAQTGRAADQAVRLAERAAEIAGALKSTAETNARKLSQAAPQQALIEQETRKAAELLERAGSLQQQLQNAQAAALQEVAAETRNLAETALPPARQALSSSPDAVTAEPPVQAARAALEEQVARLQAALSGAGSSPQTPNGAQQSEGTPTSQQQAQAMAKAMEKMNSQQAASPNGKPSAASAQQAQSLLASAQQKAMNAARASLQQAQDGQGAEGLTLAQGQAAGALPELAPLAPGEWGKLRRQDAAEMMQSRGEGVASEYRTMVETYFRVVAERVRQK
jgi:hypothetical protein